MQELSRNADGCGTENDDIQRGKNKEHQRRNHLHGGLGRPFFGALPPLGPQVIRVDPEGPGDAGSESIGLNQHRHQCLDVVDSCPGCELTQGLDPGLADAYLRADQVQLLTELWMGDAQFLRHTQERLVEC